MKQTRGRGIDNPGGAFADDGEPLQDTGEALYGSPYTGIPAKPTAKIVVDKSITPWAPYTWEAT